MKVQENTMPKLKAEQAVVGNAPSVWIVREEGWGTPNIAIVQSQEHAEEYAKLFAAAPDLLSAAIDVMMARVPGLNFDLAGHPDMLALEAAIKKAEA